ncbi:ASCH domain-containing protein [Rhodococcoides corynebacterioides]|uniref:ASCH domain-containing protein n=1 Tax=Nocardiaceae TaxID=85025 RepID=UPI0035305576
MSIHPVYAAAIMSGRKTIEFRKRRLADDIATVWVYATTPIRRVIGRFEILEIVEMSPTLLWQQFGKGGCISRGDFDKYYAKHASGVGIRIGTVVELETPLLLADVVLSGVPPQSFLYVQNAVFDELLTAL